MKELKKDGQKYRLPSRLNDFQEKLYIRLIDWKHITKSSGKSRNLEYDAILPDNIHGDWLHIYPDTRKVLEDHRKRFPFRLHKFFDHMASSQAANINLFLPILQHCQAAAILKKIKPDLARVATERLDQGYQIEFWDAGYGSLWDKTSVSGTDSDLAIAYYNHDNELCLWLIEHKLTETEFTTCGGSRSKSRQKQHDCDKSFAELIGNPTSCYYHDVKKFNYWKITESNQDFFVDHMKYNHCPFKGGMNQLWRNQLLALAMEQDTRQEYKHVTFSVVRHPRNMALEETLSNYQVLIGNNPKFTTFTSADIVKAAMVYADDELQRWTTWYKELYDV